MGKYHGKLRPNKRLEIPRHFIFYDTETSPRTQPDGTKIHVLKLGVACYLRRAYGKHLVKEDWFHFTKLEEFWSWVESKFHTKMKIFLIAHNQQFDSLVVDMFRELPKRGWTLKYPIIDSKLFIAKFTKDTRTIQALDTLNWFKFSLKKLGDFVGRKKLKIDFETCSDAELEYYCQSDVEIIKHTIMKWLEFIQAHDLGCFQYTVASQAFVAFRHKYMKTPIYIHDFPAPIKLERASYRGGRSEAFYIGLVKEHVTLLDFNSLYASVMIDNLYPTKLIKHIQKAAKDGLIRALRKYLVIARVNVSIDQPVLGIKTARLTFPVGRFDAVLTSPELIYVYKHGKINAVHEYAIYEYAQIFKEYVTDLYNERLVYKVQGNDVGDLMTKLMLNSLYGKFGQRVERQELIGHVDSDIISVERGIIHETKERVRIKTFAGNVYRISRGKDEGKHSFPAIASFTSSYARMKLWNAMQLAGLLNVYYVDTDSLFVNDTGLKNLSPIIDSEKLGHLKIEGDGNDLYVNGLKDYVFLGETKIKGVKRGAQQIGLSTFKQPYFMKFRSMVAKGVLNAPVETTVIKHLKREYRKGIVQNDGTVKPFNLPEDQKRMNPIHDRRGRDLPTKLEIYNRAMAIYMTDNLGISYNRPTLDELRENNYIVDAQHELMRS